MPAVAIGGGLNSSEEQRVLLFTGDKDCSAFSSEFGFTTCREKGNNTNSNYE